MRSLDDDSRLTHFGDHPCHFSRYSTLPWGQTDGRGQLEEIQHTAGHIHKPCVSDPIQRAAGNKLLRAAEEGKKKKDDCRFNAWRERGGAGHGHFSPLFKRRFSVGWRQWQRGWVASKHQLLSGAAVTRPHMATRAGLEPRTGPDRWGMSM